MQNDIDDILGEIASKDSQVLCREMLSIGDTMDVLRSKWTVEILTAILCGNTRFKDILTAIHGMSDKVLTERLRQMASRPSYREARVPRLPSACGIQPHRPWETALCHRLSNALIQLSSVVIYSIVFPSFSLCETENDGKHIGKR